MTKIEAKKEVGKEMETEHLVLVHGLCHGAWCWYKVAALLKAGGHRVSTLDLGACGVNPNKLEEISSMADYVRPLMDLMASLPSEENVVLVGHSYGGLGIALAMENFPSKVSVAVFISAYMPRSREPPALLIQEYFRRMPAESVMDCEFTCEDEGEGNMPKSVVLGFDYLTKVMYQHCGLEDIELGKMLVRPSGFFVKDMAKEGLLTEENYGSVKRVFVSCKEDPVFDEEFQRYVMEYSPPHALKTIAGAGHMVMFSDPNQLLNCLQEILHNPP